MSANESLTPKPQRADSVPSDATHGGANQGNQKTNNLCAHGGHEVTTGSCKGTVAPGTTSSSPDLCGIMTNLGLEADSSAQYQRLEKHDDNVTLIKAKAVSTLANSRWATQIGPGVRSFSFLLEHAAHNHYRLP